MEFMLTREQAWDIVCEFTKSEGLRKHALAVETCVAAYAKQLGEDEHKWSITALLHDFDWEIHPQAPDHPMLGEAILAERGVDEEIRAAPSSRMPTTAACRASLPSKKCSTPATNWPGSSPPSPTSNPPAASSKSTWRRSRKR